MAINGAATAGNLIWQEGATTIQLTDGVKSLSSDSGTTVELSLNVTAGSTGIIGSGTSFAELISGLATGESSATKVLGVASKVLAVPAGLANIGLFVNELTDKKGANGELGGVETNTALNAIGGAMGIIAVTPFVTGGAVIALGIGAVGLTAFTLIRGGEATLKEEFGSVFVPYSSLTPNQRTELATMITAGSQQPWLYGQNIPKVGDPLYDLYKATRDWWKHELGHISDTVNSLWEQARNWIARYDPLALDLDGDGIETVGVNATTHILFDHNNDGIKTGTGWVNGDDGLLVLDRNGNGVIDNGSELFGDGTMVNGIKATDGFSALRFRHPERVSGSKREVNNLDFNKKKAVA